MDVTQFYLSCPRHLTLGELLEDYLQEGLGQLSQPKLSKSNIRLYTNEMHTFNCWSPFLFIED